MSDFIRGLQRRCDQINRVIAEARATEAKIKTLLAPLRLVDGLARVLNESARLIQASTRLNNTFRIRNVVLTYRESGHPNYIEFAKDLRETPADGPFGVLIINARLLYGPGTPAGDALLISDNRIKGEHRFEAAKRFARRHLRLSLANPRAQSALRRLIAEDHFAKRRLIETTLPGLIWEVADSCHRYQNVRLGHSWKTSTRGKRKKIRPAVDLNPWDYLQWIRQRVYARLTDTICKEELAEEVPAYDISLLRLSESNTELPEGDLLDDQFSKLTKSERRYAQKLWAALEEGNDLKQARKITRRSLRIRANHERVLFFRTRHRGTAKRPQLN